MMMLSMLFWDGSFDAFSGGIPGVLSGFLAGFLTWRATIRIHWRR
jgi:hypothetical protein